MIDVIEVTSRLIADDMVVGRALLTPVSGGVSSDVWRVSAADLTPRVRAASPHGLIVKSPLARLRVPQVWEASIARGTAEAAALELLARITPHSVPRVLWQDADLPAIAVESAPLDWADWRDQLGTGDADGELLCAARISAICNELGVVVATWHASTTDLDLLPEVLTTGDRLRSLRTNPFHRASASALPAVADALTELAEELEGQRICLVHGDVSPKNVLVGADSGMWVIDAEVAHVGNPVLDVAFLSAHLLLKAVWLPALRARLDAGRHTFGAAYRSTSSLVPIRSWNRQTGAVLAARVRGLSQVGYLNESEREWVLTQALDLITERADLDEVWSRLDAT